MDDEDEDSVWGEAMQGVKPLKPASQKAGGAVKRRQKPAVDAGFVIALPPVPVKTSAPKGRAVDGRTAERFRKGKMPIEGRIDLHGYTLAEAERILQDFIKRSYARRLRCLLVITGKGEKKADDRPWYESRGGTIRQHAPGWLGASAFRDMVLSFSPAQPKDGGNGAFYVLLRRQRD